MQIKAKVTEIKKLDTTHGEVLTVKADGWFDTDPNGTMQRAQVIAFDAPVSIAASYYVGREIRITITPV